jgi:hypothetical protein
MGERQEAAGSLHGDSHAALERFGPDRRILSGYLLREVTRLRA